MSEREERFQDLAHSFYFCSIYMIVSICSAEGQISASSETSWVFTIGTPLEFVSCSTQFAPTSVEQNKLIIYFHCCYSWISLVSESLMAFEHCYGQFWHSHDYWLFAEQLEQCCCTRENELEDEAKLPGKDCALSHNTAVVQQWGRMGRPGYRGQGPRHNRVKSQAQDLLRTGDRTGKGAIIYI